MSQNLLPFSMFQRVMFPPEDADGRKAKDAAFQLRRKKRFKVGPDYPVQSQPLVVFDFETTGLDFKRDKIIEIGAIKIVNFEEIEILSELVDPEMQISPEIEALTGITNGELVGKPKIDEVLPKMLKIMEGGILVAHNADFDLTFLKRVCDEQDIDLDWPTFCTLKMARKFLPQLDSKNLDTIAKHYKLSFESRHRSIGDIRVTYQVLKKFFKEHPEETKLWKQLEIFQSV